jgi:hypothetical protein
MHHKKLIPGTEFIAQIILYLKLSDKKSGYLININVPIFKVGIYRYVNKY